MATVLLAWEIGEGHGHVRNLLAVAALVAAAGHRAVFALPTSQVTAARLVEAGGHPVEAFQLPTLPSLNQYLPPLATYRAASFVDVMGLLAFDSADRLAPLTQRYLNIMHQYGVDVVVGECAPVAAFAANLAHVPCVGVGTSFGLPEVSQGFDIYPQFDPAPVTPLFKPAQLLTVAETAAGCALGSLADAIAPKRIVPFCYPALDHYGHQRGLSHRGVGPIWRLPVQPKATHLRGFAYLQQAYPAINAVVSSIRRSGIPFNVYVRGGRYRSAGNMRVLDSFDLAQELACASCVLHHGSAGIGQAAMSAGIPQLCMPYHVENTNNAYRLQMLGVAKGIGYAQHRDFLGFLIDSDDQRAESAHTVANQLAAHANEFPGAAAAAAAIDDLL